MSLLSLVIVAAIGLSLGSSFLYKFAITANAETASDFVAASDIVIDNRKLQNGSFEDDQTWTDAYKQPYQNQVPYWNTTAFQGKIELFRQNNGVYIKVNGASVKLAPTDGNYAAELNADEESTLYQNVVTTPSSVYEWGLDHGGRNGTDTMALVIGPKQGVDPSKPSKNGRDQLMQMVDWLIAQGKTSVKTSAGLGEQFTVYSKKFGTNGTFEDNAGNNAFSLTPSSIYTEKWQIWIMASSRATSGTNPWNSYGSNAEGSAENSPSNNSVDLSKYYLYTVPAGQTETLFGFVSVGYVDSITSADKAKTYGNFLDNINFRIYHPLTGSTTNHGSAIVGESDGSSGGTGSSEGHKITIDNQLATYVTDGESLKIQAIINAQDVDDGCLFVGVYYTNQDENGNPVSTFLKIAGNEIEDTGSLTEAEKKGKWIKSTNEVGDIVYTYYLDNLTSATDLHFIFIKNPTVTYDPNGGKEYIVDRVYNTDEDENVYSFKPLVDIVDKDSFIDPYVSHAAEGQNDGWKFLGWKLTGDIVDNISSTTELVNADKLGSLLLPAVHTIACDYNLDCATGEKAAQYFKIYDGDVPLTKVGVTNNNDKLNGITNNDSGETKLYANVHRGITMVAQWRWRQAIIPQVDKDGVFVDSTEGGTVEIISVTDKTDENYTAEYNENGGKSYHAATGETVTIKAYANTGCSFLGWYDEDGNLITTNDEYTYVETKESVNTYYARFSNTVTQTYIRQIKSGDDWVDITDDKIGVLGRYSYTDAVGKPISSTATASSGYRFVGWYDSEGNKVGDDMLINNGVTISYTTTGDATYYARFDVVYTLNVSKIDGNNSTDTSKVPLAGAQFTLYQKDDSGTKTIVYDGTRIKCTAVSVATTALNSAKTKATAVFKDKLIPGMEYYLAETKAPSGYRLLNEPLKITVSDSSGTATAEIDGISKDISAKEVNIELANYLTLHVPTAGITITEVWFTAAGLLLLIAATIGLFWFNKNRLRKKNLLYY
ncbi:MAG: prealbumin-like fold domain-containing protein [Acutalibacteraceae bacterium]|nr:prealbumin-like fold domain-containing protein [Acutalibacteraceae bacterium]